MTTDRVTRTKLNQMISASSGLERDTAPSENPTFTSNGITLIPDQRHLIGEGLLSQVFRGFQGDRAVAVKLFSPRSDLGPPNPEITADDRGKFETEIELLKSTDHLNIAKFITPVSFVTPAGFLDGFARELFVDTVDKTVTSDQHEQILSMVFQIASALEYLATEKKVFVTDLAPANIMVRSDGSYALSDLNLTASERTTVPAYSEGFVAPEVANLSGTGAVLTSSTYSLAMVAYRLMGGIVQEDEMSSIFGQQLVKPKDMSERVFDVLQAATISEPTKRLTPTKFAEALTASAKL